MKKTKKYFVRERANQWIKLKGDRYVRNNDSTIHYFNTESLAKEFYDNKVAEYNENSIYQVQRNEVNPSDLTYERIELIGPKEELYKRREDIIIELCGTEPKLIEIND